MSDRRFPLGGQTISQIVDRVLADPVAGKYWDMIFEGGINDVQADGPTWWAILLPQYQRLLAFRAPGTKLLVVNLHESLSWTS